MSLEMTEPCPERDEIERLKLENGDLRKKTKRISAKLLEDERMQTARECAEMVGAFMVSEPSDWLSSPNLYLGRARDAILRKFGIEVPR